ncbi:MAG TPA: SDR family NAD(P)-dependent oxidoreductase, partial [Desulfobaccales bacterium]|nr:SDR family NAD(P)-dependent oxidoreductase [Desulfobaccales bacterium]
MLDDLRGKVALVTGASRGIGRGAAIALAAAGADVAVNYRSREEAAAAACAEIERRGVRAVAVQADVSQSPAVARMVAAVEENLGPVDILVNNAGIVEAQPLAEITEADWDEMLAVNLKSTFLVTQQ